jgi:hypothetical protein
MLISFPSVLIWIFMDMGLDFIIYFPFSKATFLLPRFG